MSSVHARIIEILLPQGGLVLELVEFYLDESEQESAQVLCVAGYLFDKTKCDAMSLKWSKVLKRHGLPYFHMVDCVHGNGAFSNMPKQERIDIQTQLIDLIKESAIIGFAFSVDKSRPEIFQHIHHPSGILSPYVMCAYGCLAAGRHWADGKGFDGEIAYIFEAGHASQIEANALMNFLFREAGLRAEYRHGGHSFMPKDKSVPLQAADILAYLWCKHIKDARAGRRIMRADLKSLLEIGHKAVHYGEKQLYDMRFASIVSKAEAESLSIPYHWSFWF